MIWEVDEDNDGLLTASDIHRMYADAEGDIAGDYPSRLLNVIEFAMNDFGAAAALQLLFAGWFVFEGSCNKSGTVWMWETCFLCHLYLCTHGACPVLRHRVHWLHWCRGLHAYTVSSVWAAR
jgi:hypothetical protein